MGDTKNCTSEIRSGRLNKANQFLRAAEIIESVIDDEDLADAYVTLCVHAGIAAADVICCTKLQVHSTSTNHKKAVALLATVDQINSTHLNTLIDLKTHAGYTENPTSPDTCKSAGLAARELVRSAQNSINY